uniref:Putative secreted protein n=1 Tax=Anopheles marajoara TaxID=58244 RepID=A0A2M4CE61_9DIPT
MCCLVHVLLSGSILFLSLSLSEINAPQFDRWQTNSDCTWSSPMTSLRSRDVIDLHDLPRHYATTRVHFPS